MDIKQATELLRFLSGAYPQFRIGETTPEVWYEMLKDQDFDAVMYRVRRHIEKSPQPPAISDLKVKRYGGGPVIG